MLKDKLIIADKNLDQPTAPGKARNIKVIKHTRVNFKFNRSKFESVKKGLTQNYQIVKTDDNLFGNIDGSVVPKKLELYVTKAIFFIYIGRL